MSDGATQDTTSGFGRGMLLLVLANAVYVITAYATTTATARVLDPDDFGGFGVVMGWISLITALLVKGLSTSIAREMSAGEVDSATAWRAGARLGLRLSVGLAVVGAAMSPLAANAFGSGELASQLAIGALGSLTFGLNAVLLAWPTGQRQYGWQAVAQLSYAVARVALVVGGAMVAGLPGAVIGYVLAPLLAAAPIARRRPAATSDIAPVAARMARAMVPVAAASAAVTAFFVVDIFAMSAVLGGSARPVGIYVAYGTVAHVPFFLLQASSVAMVPAIAAATDAAGRTDAIRRTLTDTVVLLAGPTLLLVTAGDAAARVVFGAAYHSERVVVAPLALATAAVTLIAGLVAVGVAVARMRAVLAISALGVAAVACAAALGAHAADRAPESSVAIAVGIATVATFAALAIAVRLTHGGLLYVRRSLAGLALAAATSLPPLLADDDGLAMGIAAISGVVWLVLVLRFGLIDLARAKRIAPDPVELEPAL